MQLITSKLNETQLRKLGKEFERILNAKHKYIWRDDVLDLIQYMHNFNPHWSNHDIYDRLGGTFVDWSAQEIKDNRDWEETFEEVAKIAQLDSQETMEFRGFMTGYTEE